ncbi:ankyrin repeat-containing domain protein [Polychytrium aggregatum]|uniref:ankyrin repeat-containing domain protein n=1 Tax=Polychytrium aggregatum TaxID=110093 RepID=UPI0022FEA5EB|nr:ankyrin repeat-containing domain protein [Polychytrium aggregatum]KAI9205253.1 ankyrin repeat-containing domain protein [Polychytrium aggregatum]
MSSAHRHHDCSQAGCHIPNPVYAQSLDELEFERSLPGLAQSGDSSRVQKLLAKGADPNQPDSSGYTALVRMLQLPRPCCDLHDREHVALCTSSDAPHPALVNPIFCPCSGQQHYASRQGNVSLCRMLLDAGADPNAATMQLKTTALHRSAAQGHLSVTKLLLASGAKPDGQDDRGQTALHAAAQNGHLDVVRLILNTSADPAGLKATRDRKGQTASDLTAVDDIRALLCAS